MLVITAPGEERSGRLLVDELDLLGLTSQLEPGHERAAEAAHEDSNHRAIVWLHDEHQARIWLKGEDPSAHHDVASSESRELLALRTAELLRGRLLPGEDPPSREEEAAPREPEVRANPRFHLFGGPGLIVSSYAEPLPAFSLGLAYQAWSRMSVGAFVVGSLADNAWQGNPEELTASQFSLGGRLGLTWLALPAGRIRSDLLLRATFRGLQVRSERGGPMEKGSATLWGPTVDLGVDGRYELTPWFGLGMEACFVLGFPLGRSASLDNGMPPAANSPILVATDEAGVDVQVVTSFLAVASW